MQNKSRGPYPMHPAMEGCTLLTVCERLHHQNIIAKHRAKEAINTAREIYNEYKNKRDLLGAIMLLLADVPDDQLMTAKPENKASVLGLCALGVLIHHEQTGRQAQQIAAQGEGVMILRISGELEKPKYEIELFNTWAEYEDFLRPILAAGDFAPGKNSTLL